MTFRAAINTTLRFTAAMSDASAVLHSAYAVAALHGVHDPWHMSRARRRGRHAQRALQRWAGERGIDVRIPAMEKRRAEAAAKHMAAASAFARASAATRAGLGMVG